MKRTLMLQNKISFIHKKHDDFLKSLKRRLQAFTFLVGNENKRMVKYLQKQIDKEIYYK